MRCSKKKTQAECKERKRQVKANKKAQRLLMKVREAEAECPHGYTIRQWRTRSFSLLPLSTLAAKAIPIDTECLKVSRALHWTPCHLRQIDDRLLLYNAFEHEVRHSHFTSDLSAGAHFAPRPRRTNQDSNKGPINSAAGRSPEYPNTPPLSGWALCVSMRPTLPRFKIAYLPLPVVVLQGSTFTLSQ